MKNIREHISKYFIDLDISKKSTIMISGMGRSGTTWLSDLINYQSKYRDIFEPFHPYKVDTANKFRYLQYLNPAKEQSNLAEYAKIILSGNFRSTWTDVNNKRLIFSSRIIKDIRTNLMLGWLKSLRPDMPIILIVRSPYSVIDSYKTLGWGIEAGGTKSDFTRIVEQKNLLKDFPIIEDISKSIDTQEYIKRLIFQWCVLYYVPLQQLKDDEFLLIQYENLLLNPKNTLEVIFNYINEHSDISEILKNIEKPSVTNYRNINFTDDNNYLITKWIDSLSTSEIEMINEMINSFKLDYLYDKNGYPLKK